MVRGPIGAGDRVRFNVLGTLEAVRGQERVRLPAGRGRVVLALLVLNANRVVTADRLIEAAWNGHSPATVRTQLHALVSALRRALAPAEIATIDPGYLLRVEPDGSDLVEFLAGVDRGRQAAAQGSPEEAARCLAAALALWRGTAFEGLDCRILTDEAERLEQVRRSAAQECARIELDLGRVADARARLGPLVRAQPLDEGLRESLMRALYRSGRRAEALGTYREVHQTLVREVGVEPGASLQELYQRILLADPPPGGAAPAPRRPAVAQLPADLTDFIGRDQLVKSLYEWLTGTDPERSGGAVVGCAITGPGGIGKTALAVHVAHRVRDHFPDGQLYVDLGGVGGKPREPVDVLGRFLRDLDVPPARIPSDVDERAARYRSLLADRRMLVVLDNARDTAQITPLLPGTASCAVLLTSRHRMAGWYGHLMVNLEALEPDESRALLGEIVGVARASAEPDATAEIVAACAGIPLALRIAGARLAGRPGWRIRDLADRLTDRQRRLRELFVSNLELRSSFQDSYRDLPVAASAHGISPARAFRLLGAAELPTLGLAAASALFDQAPEEAEAALAVLVDECLLDEPLPGRYRFHDLIRDYAGECATEEAPEQSRAAVGRLLRWFLATAAAADMLLDPRPRRTPAYQMSATPRLPMSTYDEALAWFTLEHDNLLAAVHLAAANGWPDIAWQLACVLYTFLELRSMWTELTAVNHTGVAAARAAGDAFGIGTCLIHLAIAMEATGQIDAAMDFLEQALATHRENGDRISETVVLANMGNVQRVAGRYTDAMQSFRSVLALARATGNSSHMARALLSLSEVHNDVGQFTEAVELCRQCLDHFREHSDRISVGLTLSQLGRGYQGLRSLDEAVRAYREALAIHVTSGAEYWQGMTLLWLGDAERDLGHDDEARRCWQQAAATLAGLGAAEAAQASARLAG